MCSVFFPASGNRNGTGLNNRGSNGNYWSASLNSQTNGYNLNFNSTGVNPANNNNRFNGFSVRAVQHLCINFLTVQNNYVKNSIQPFILPTDKNDSSYRLTREQLLFDLYIAYYDAARHKHKMAYVVKFARNLRDNLEELCDDLLNHRYKALPSKCFIIDYPKKREVFAAMFRDRIVHHLYFRYTHQLFERTFIADSYSCIEGRGTHYGIARLGKHIRQASLNWTQPCYAMNLDIRGYFMHINRQKLLTLANDSLRKMATHKVGMTDDVPVPSGVLLTPATRWCDIRDFDLIMWLTEEIIMLDPMENCIIVGNDSDWDGIDHAKCMRFVKPGLALPIGNLTSQLYSNVYLNPFDQWIKRDLRCEHYGRYVDDSTMIDACHDWLLAQVPKVREFLYYELGLELHMGKVHIQ